MVKKVFKIKVVPNSPETKVVEISGDETIRINIHAPAQEGKANQELIRFLTKKLHLPPEKIRILSGKSARLKLIQIETETPPDLQIFAPGGKDV